ncbi:MAG: 4-hydroxy-tetrahydrodipicolinate reductase [Clostridia bacterium]|nr:4-hydroxy-tetrahydrodipicolinate reductase [Clostridia bacterium]
MRILISGALGHMGRAVAEQAAVMGVEIACGVDVTAAQETFPVYASFEDVTENVDAVVDFSKPDSLGGLLAFAKARQIPAVLATTGYSDDQLEAIDKAAGEIPLFRSANMSVGVALLRLLCRKAAEVLGDDFDVEIVEAHHNRKVDAPSGTAVMLYDAIKDAYDDPRYAVNGRSGRDCKRQRGEIGMHALRGGTVTGEHEVCFFGQAERVKISHSAENRSIFAVGALRAAAFLQGKAPGLYNMDDMLA